jgi:hypothetical protein
MTHIGNWAQSIRGDLSCLNASAARQRIAAVACLQHGIEIVVTPMHFPVPWSKLTAESGMPGCGWLSYRLFRLSGGQHASG